MRPSRQAFATASMLEPRPEMRMASFSTEPACARDRCVGSPRSLVNHHAGSALAHFAEERRGLAACGQQPNALVRTIRRNDGNHADAAVEGAVHLRAIDTRSLLQPVEHRVAMPRAALEV